MTNKELLKIIVAEKIQDQGELLKKIKDCGYVMTQSTLSRRLSKLGIRKKHGIYIAPNFPDISMGHLIQRIDESPPNLLVLHTPPGHAHALASQLDYISFKDYDSISNSDEATTEDIGFSEIVGTIAGDDTVLVVTRPGQLEKLKQKISQLS